MPVAGTVISASNTPRQLSDGNDQGTTLGQSGLTSQGLPDQIGFFGLVAPQPSGNAQAALVRGNNSGMVMSYSSSPTLTAVTALQSAEYNMTLTTGSTGATMTLASTDLLIINKPSAQAGLGVGNMRYVSATQVGVTFSNFGTLTVTPTAAEVYSFVAIRGLNTVTTVITPAAIAPQTTAEQIFTVTGVRVGECVMVNKPTTNTSADIAGVRVAGNNQVGITFVNVSATTVTPTAGQTYTIFSNGGIDAVQNHFLAQVVNVTPGTVASAAFGNLTLTSVNILVDDTVVGVQKPTLQTTVGLTGGFVSAANTLKIFAVNPTLTTATPTAGEIYTLTMMRPNMIAPAVVYTATLTPASVAANTTAEQTFVVTGVVAGSTVVVNKPSSQAGLGIMGARVSSANNIAITFCNATATTITPTAGEVYTVANFQQKFETTTPYVTNAICQPAAVAQFGANTLVNAVRNAMVTQGQIAGA